MSSKDHTVVDEWITASDGHSLYTKTWKPVGEVTATLVLIHGFGEHVSRYEHVTSEFAKAGILTYGYDQRGFGETGQKTRSLGITGGFEKILSDLDEALVKTKQKGKPQFLFGHSMGGMIALQYAAVGANRLELIDGIISSAPLVTSVRVPPAPILMILKGIAEIIPSFQIKVDIPPEYISRDSAEVKRYIADPLVHSVAGLKSTKELINRGNALLTKTVGDKITQPILQSHGTDDKINIYDASKAAFDVYASTDKTWMKLDGYYHEPHNEPEKEDIIKQYIAWLQKQIAKHNSQSI